LTTTVVGADDEAQYITCGSVIKIKHKDTGYYLHSEEKSLGSGSGQQIVTFYNDAGTHDALWRLRPANHHVDGKEYPEDVTSCELAQPIACGTIVRLTHLSTNRNLHSHGVESVLSHQQEVTGYGTGDGKGDGGDNWIVECVGTSQKQFWKRGASVRLFHQDTQKYLGTSKNTEFNEQTCGHSCPIMGHLEAFGRSNPDAHTLFTTDQGIHFSK
jgi:dolichyl-phosphate-mannose--protein O-mannosyl transferase